MRGPRVVIPNFAVEIPNFAVEIPNFAVVPETPKNLQIPKNIIQIKKLMSRIDKSSCLGVLSSAEPFWWDDFGICLCPRRSNRGSMFLGCEMRYGNHIPF